MAAATPAPSSSAYSFVSYPSDYGYAGSPYIPPQSSPPMSQSDMPAVSGPPLPYPPYGNFAFAHMGPIGAPSSPMMTHAHLPPSPIIHPNAGPAPCSERSSAESKVMRHMMTAMTKMQSTMKEFADRHEQILDRMSLLEQRVGRIDDNIGRILDNSEQIVEDTKDIRTRVEDNESSQEAFETRLQDLLDAIVDRFVGGIGEELKDIKCMVKNTERSVKRDPYAWDRRLSLSQQMHDREVLGEEAQEALLRA